MSPSLYDLRICCLRLTAIPVILNRPARADARAGSIRNVSRRKAEVLNDRRSLCRARRLPQPLKGLVCGHSNITHGHYTPPTHRSAVAPLSIEGGTLVARATKAGKPDTHRFPGEASNFSPPRRPAMAYTASGCGHECSAQGGAVG